MPDVTGPPQESFAAGMFSGRVHSEDREAAQVTYYQLVSVDAGPTAAGATITSAMTSQTTGYQIQASFTWFATVTPGVTGNGNTPTAACVLPQTSRPYPFGGLQLAIANYGANPINCYAHPSDIGNMINGQLTNVPVVLGPNTVTPFQCLVGSGVWNAVDIGGGFNGSIETVVSQGNVASAGTTNATATQITQAIVNVTSGGASPAGVTLPPAKAGSQVAIANNIVGGATTLTVYGAGADTINGSATQTIAFQVITIFICAVNGNWLTK